MTVTLQIGNSDDKLSQAEWHKFVANITGQIDTYASRIHFFGAPPNHAQWQNVAWIFDVDADRDLKELRANVVCVRSVFKQESAAWTEGKTQFI